MRRILVWGLALAMFAGCSREEPAPDKVRLRDEHVYEPVRIVETYLAMVEKPDAARALLIGDEAKRLAPYFSRAGVKPETARSGRFDLVVIACAEMSRESCAKAAEMMTDNGVIVWLMDMREVTMRRFRSQLESFDLAECHLWMPGEDRWVLIGRRVPKKIKLSSMLEVFAREAAFPDLAQAACSTVPELFANYAGNRQDVEPAFENADMEAVVRPEFFLTREIPSADWMVTEGVDADIASGILTDVRSMQVIRRLVVEGNMLAAQAQDNAGMQAAAERWSRATLRNPNDLFLLARLDRMDRNARGFLNDGRILEAMKCYETLLVVKPTAPRLHNFGMCLRKLGKTELADRVFARAKELEK